MDKGIYCLVFENPRCTARVGARGEIIFREGWHVYVGSALGSGGLKRLDRHIALARTRDRPPKWHVDYLLTNPAFSLRYAVWASTQDPLECQIARALGDPYIPAFGCSDCACTSHLFYRERDPRHEILAVFTGFQLAPVTKTIINP
jgi:Uri superfamily endonuclease